MGSWGSADFRELKELQKRFEELGKGDKSMAFTKQIARELGARLLREVRKKTPVGEYSDLVSFTTAEGKHVTFKISDVKAGGTLRENWQKGGESQSGRAFTIEIVNPTEYASYVEKGRRIVNKGRTVGYVQGQFMLKISEDELRAKVPLIIEKRLEMFLRKELGL